MADEERTLVIKFISDLSDPERGLDRLEERASRGIRVAGGRSGFAEPGVFSSAPRGYSPGASSDVLSERFELRYQNRLATDLARTERARERESRAAERAAAAEEKRAAAAERVAERVAARSGARVEANWQATEFAQFRQQARQVQGYRDLYRKTVSDLADEGTGGTGRRNVGDYLFRRVVLGAAIYGGGRFIEAEQSLNQEMTLAGDDPLAQYKATEAFYKSVSGSVPFLGAAADFIADTGGRQQTRNALTIASAQATDALTQVRQSNAEASLRLGAAARAAGESTEYARRRSTIESSFEATKRQIRQRQRQESDVTQRNFDLNQSELDQRFNEEAVAASDDPSVGRAGRLAAVEARRRLALGDLNRRIGASRAGINRRFAGDVQSAEDIEKGQLRDIDAGPARQLEALRGQTQSLNLQAQNRPLESTLAAQRAAGTVEMMGAQTPELANAIAVKNVQELFETISKFLRETRATNIGNFGRASVNRLIAAGEPRAAGAEAIRIAREEELAKLPAGIAGAALRPGVNARFDSEQVAYNRQQDIQEHIETQQLQDREAVARLQSQGRERSARSAEIQGRAEEEAAAYQERDSGPLGRRRARSALQTGLYEEQAYLRQLKLETEGEGRSAQDIGKGGIGAGYVNQRPNQEPLTQSIERVEKAIRDLERAIFGVE